MADLRTELIQLLGINLSSTDGQILNEVRKLKGVGGEAVAMHAAKPLAALATQFQKRAAEGGIKYDFATCVNMVRDGTSW